MFIGRKGLHCSVAMSDYWRTVNRRFVWSLTKTHPPHPSHPTLWSVKWAKRNNSARISIIAIHSCYRHHSFTVSFKNFHPPVHSINSQHRIAEQANVIFFLITEYCCHCTVGITQVDSVHPANVVVITEKNRSTSLQCAKRAQELQCARKYWILLLTVACMGDRMASHGGNSITRHRAERAERRFYQHDRCFETRASWARASHGWGGGGVNGQ
jgi:hypothetical protein